VCAFCGKRLRSERIEEFSIFKRIEEEFISPAPWYITILWLFTKPNRAFWNINHKRKNAPGYKILLFNSFIYGLMGLAFFSHISIQSIPPFSLGRFFIDLAAFIAFFAFGFLFYFIFGLIMIWFFTKGADFAVDFSEKLEARFGEKKEGIEKYSEAEMSPFSIYKGGTLHQQQASKSKMMLCAFAPYLLINSIEILIILIGIPNITIPNLLSIDLNSMFVSPTWTVLHLIDALTIAVWVPILITLAIRELSNSSTFRVLISSLTIGIIVAVFFYFALHL
jgi:hypothetical protein